MTAPINIVHIAGKVVTAPRLRELPGGNAIWTFEVAPSEESGSIPVWYEETYVPAQGSVVDIMGEITSRYFRVGGATQRKVEVHATSIRRSTT